MQGASHDDSASASSLAIGGGQGNAAGSTSGPGPAPMTAVAQPKGWRYVAHTWSGRILLINTLIFLLICVKSHSILLPDTATLVAFGAKDPVRLAQGEYWRLLAPIFIHIGIVHFAFNSYFLYVVGYQIERLLGSFWFLAVYLGAGILGNLASGVFSVNMSAGASSSLFGLLGAGLLLERLIGTQIKKATGRRPRNRAYAITVLINLGFGFVVPFIDNSAHIGGLVAGVLLTFAMVQLRGSSWQKPRRGLGWVAVGAYVAAFAVGLYYVANVPYVLGRLVRAGDHDADSEDKLYHYTQALTLAPEESAVRLKRARELFAAGEANFALHDVREIIAKGDQGPALAKLADELEAGGHPSEAWEVKRMLAHGSPSL